MNVTNPGIEVDPTTGSLISPKQLSPFKKHMIIYSNVHENQHSEEKPILKLRTFFFVQFDGPVYEPRHYLLNSWYQFYFYVGWPWYTADIPPNDVYDCIFLFFACSDYEGQGSTFYYSTQWGKKVGWNYLQAYIHFYITKLVVYGK